MPELPEVESVRLQLQSFLVGHTIEAVEIKYIKSFIGNKKKIEGGKVIDVRRFAKVLTIDLDNGRSLVIHIKLTGQLIYRGPNLKQVPKLSKKVVGGVPGKHTHVIFKLDRSGILYYNDVRKFGWINVVNTTDVDSHTFISKLGKEPFKNLNKEDFREITATTNRSIKTLLMDQSKISGIGNIYANDALWLAMIHPARSANSLVDEEVSDLYKAIEKVLRKGLETGGASELAFVTPDGGEGKYQNHFLAYGKVGVVCPRCKQGKFQKIRIGSRGTNFCPVCQRI